VKKLIFLFWGIMLAVAMMFAQTPAMAQSVPSVPATQEQAVEQQVAEQQEAAAQQVEEATEQLAQAAEEEAAEELAQAPEQQEEAAEEPVQAPEQQEEAAEEEEQVPEEEEQVPEEEEPQVPEEEEPQVPEEEEPQVPEEEEPQVPEESPWTYIFEDPARGTELRVNTDSKTFQFIASDGYDSGVVEAEHMIVYDTSRGQLIFIRHGDSEIRLFAFAVGGEEDRCSAFAIDRETGQGYRLVAPPVHFMGRIFHSWRMASPLGAVSPR
jgi:hypothetical protein